MDNLESIVGKRIKCQVTAEAIADNYTQIKAKYGRVCRSDLAYVLGISKSAVLNYSRKLGITLDREKKGSRLGNLMSKSLKKTSVYELMAKKYAPKISKAIANGIQSMQDLEQKLGLSKSTIETVAEYSNIVLPKGKRGRKPGVFKRKPEVDRMIQLGYSQPDIAKKVGCTPQNIQIYIKRSGQSEFYRQRRSAYLEKQNPELEKKKQAKALAKIVSLVYGHMYDKAVEHENLPYKRALEYRFGNTERKLSLDSLVKLFKVYYKAVGKGEKVTYTGMARAAGMSYSNVTNVFNTLGLNHRQHLKQTKITLTREQRKQIKRVLKCDISGPDAADMLGLPKYLVRAVLKRSGYQIEEVKPLKQFVFTLGDSDALTMRKARRIYEAKDAGFNLDEVCEYTGYRNEVVDYALANKKTIERKIINALNVLYPGKKHTKSYL
jgi:predicted transcriptional regulator